MSILQCWQEQRESLRTAITPGTSPADAIQLVRRALLQTEQNALAELEDDVLRQQAGVLMSSLKGSIGLLEAHAAAQVWVAQKAEKNAPSAQRSLWQTAAAVLAAAALLCAFRGEWVAMMLVLIALALGGWALWNERRAASAVLPRDEVRVSVNVDPDRLFGILDGQMRAMDRYLSDFSYLNDQARGGAESADPLLLSRAAELLEALYDLDEAERAPADEAARRLLARLGLQAVDYDENTSRLFNALPSKSTTRTLSPAIVSAEDQKLLRRGTAAVRMDAA